MRNRTWRFTPLFIFRSVECKPSSISTSCDRISLNLLSKIWFHQFSIWCTVNSDASRFVYVFGNWIDFSHSFFSIFLHLDFCRTQSFHWPKLYIWHLSILHLSTCVHLFCVGNRISRLEGPSSLYDFMMIIIIGKLRCFNQSIKRLFINIGKENCMFREFACQSGILKWY